MEAKNGLALPAMRYSSYADRGGYLQRKTRMGFLGATKRRYVRLTGSMLQVWKSEEDYNTPGEHRPESELGLQNCRIEPNQIGLEIHVVAPHKTETFVCPTLDTYQLWHPLLHDASEKCLKDYYGFAKVLGQGHFGKVLLAQDYRTGENFAVKVIRKNKKNLRSATLIQREMDILRLVNHKNVVRLYDLFDTDTKLYFVLEYMRGGVLYGVLSKKDIHFSEERASHVLKDVLQGLEYLHSLDIVHRDIKPENILTSSQKWPFTAKLADFGLSNFLAEHTGALESKVGTPYYCAREVVVNDHYGAKADLWSVGVLAYEMLSGTKPFRGKDSVQVLLAIRDGTFVFEPQYWRHISEDAKHFVTSLICADIDKRLSASQALQHPWIVHEGRHEPLPNNVLTRLGSNLERKTIPKTTNDEHMDIV